MILHLGMIDIPYAVGDKTTVEVAEILEAKYGIFKVYAGLHMQFFADELANSLAGEIETLFLGGKPSTDPFLTGTSAIDQSFRDWLDKDGPRQAGIPGTPTLASKSGTNHRFKSKKQRKKRVSFIDTGLYQGNFKSWVD